MIERARGLGLVEEHPAGHERRVLVLVREGAHLDGDPAVDERVVTDVHGAHGAAARDVDDAILPDLIRLHSFT